MSGKNSQKTAIVVGAGVGGVATAARLAKAGLKVTVFEKNDFTGGRCSLIRHDGYVRTIYSISAALCLIVPLAFRPRTLPSPTSPSLPRSL